MKQKKRLLKGIFGILLCFLIVMGEIPLPGAMKEAKAEDTWSSLQAVFTNGGTIVLSNDVTASGSDQLTVASGKTVTLDLNGHTINRGLSRENMAANGQAINVMGTLTINDADGDGIITGGGNETGAGGGGILVDGGTLTINGGSIQGNCAVYGGGIRVTNGGRLIMTGGKITNNQSYRDGSGVYINGNSSFTMSGGEISDNIGLGTGSNATNGGGVYLGHNGTENTFIMNNGSIHSNVATNYGGGVYLLGEKSKFTITGGSITGNRAENMGGGVYVNTDVSQINISGNPVIQNNENSSGVDNVYFTQSDAKFTLTAALTDGAKIGVGCAIRHLTTERVMTSGYSTYNNTQVPSTFFTSDDSTRAIALSSDSEVKVMEHSHSFTYSASNDVITATCTAGCSLTNNKTTLTIVAPERTTYGGTESAEASFDNNLSGFNSATGKNIEVSDIKYVGRNNTTYTESPTAPTAAGDYTAKLTLNGVAISGGTGSVTAQVDYTIAKAEPTADAPTASATYGQTLADVTLTNPNSNTPGTWTWASAGTTSVGSVGSHTFKAVFTPTDTANYKKKENVDVTVTVGKAANPASVTGTAVVRKDGNTVDLAEYIDMRGATGTVSYAINGEANGCTLNGSVLTSGSDTGSITVNVSIAEDDNYFALATKHITVTITDKFTQTITAPDVTVAYGETGKRVSATTTGDGAISYAVKTGSEDYIDVDASTGELTAKRIGTATVIVTAAGTDTYEAAIKEVTVTITKATAVVTKAPEAKELVYNGSAQELVTSGTAENGTLHYALGTDDTTAPDDSAYSASIPTATEIGTYYVWYKAIASEDYLDSEPVCTVVTISKTKETAVVTKAPEAKKLIYDGSAQELVTSGTAENGTLHYALGTDDTTAPDDSAYSASIPTATEIGTYYVWYKAIASEDYLDSEPVCIVVTISKTKATAVVTKAPEAKKLVYNGSEQELVTSGTAENGTLHYALGTDDTTAPDDSAYSASIPTATEIGTYYVWYKAIASEDYLDSEPVCIVVTISKEAEPEQKNVLVVKNKTRITNLFSKYGESGYKYKFKVEDKSQRKIASVTKKGKISVKKVGSVKVSLFKKAKKGKWEKVEEQTVKTELPAVTKRITDLKVGDTLEASSFITNQSELLNKPTSYESTNKKVATVDSTTGKITILKKGNTRIRIIYGTGDGSAVYTTRLRVK